MRVAVSACLFGLLYSALSDEKVLFLRHCVRGPYKELYTNRGAVGLNYADNYTAQPFPTDEDWGVSGEALCTQLGKSMVTSLGRSLQRVLPSPVSVTADDSPRCVDTAQHLAAELNSAASVDQELFFPDKANICPPLNTSELAASVEEQLALAQTPGSYLNGVWELKQSLLAELQALVGKGAAPSMEDLPDHISEGYFVGGLFAASEAIIERFILEAGDDLPVAWGKLDGLRREELWRKWQPLHVLYGRLNHGGTILATRNGGQSLWHILQLLESGSGGSTVLVGHDTNLDSIAKLADLQWQCGPFAPNGTPPVTGLLFSREGGDVRIQAVCTPYEGELVGSVLFGPVSVGAVPVSELPMSLTALKSAVEKRLDFDCITNRTGQVLI